MRNISNLLQYNISNFRYEYRVKNATLSSEQNLAKQDMRQSLSTLSIHTEPPQLRQDSTAFFDSIGLQKLGDLLQDAAEKGRQAALKATADYGRIADQMAEIDKGVTPAQVYGGKFLQPPETSLVVQSAKPISFSYKPGEVSIKFTPASFTINWDVARAIRRYTPADFNLEVLQPPSIDFIYLGGFNDAPESTTPGFNRLV